MKEILTALDSVPVPYRCIQTGPRKRIATRCISTNIEGAYITKIMEQHQDRLSLQWSVEYETHRAYYDGELIFAGKGYRDAFDALTRRHEGE